MVEPAERRRRLSTVGEELDECSQQHLPRVGGRHVSNEF